VRGLDSGPEKWYNEGLGIFCEDFVEIQIFS
jgi:hypothetical protein